MAFIEAAFELHRQGGWSHHSASCSRKCARPGSRTRRAAPIDSVWEFAERVHPGLPGESAEHRGLEDSSGEGAYPEGEFGEIGRVVQSKSVDPAIEGL
jgi:hypothetical protein